METTDSYNCFDLDRTIQEIANELNVSASQVRAAVELLDGGDTIPFIARYRKEATQALDEIALRAIEDALAKARELAQRKTAILKSIDQQEKLSDALRKKIEACAEKKELEDLYLPYKPKRRTRAAVARERGLQPLAELLLRQERDSRSKQELLKRFVNQEKEVPDTEAALQGACDIIAEQWAEEAETRAWLGDHARRFGRIASQVKRGKKEEGSKFEMYFDHRERVQRLPSHRLLAMKRGEAEGLLRVGVEMEDEEILRKLKHRWIRNPNFSFRDALEKTAEDCYQRLLHSAAESAILQEAKEQADQEAITVFAKNLRELLLSPPAGEKATIGIDPGFRTGCKVAVVDGAGKYLANAAIYPTPPRKDIQGAEETLLKLIEKYRVQLIAIGNGTASRETDAFVAAMLKKHGLKITKVMVNESGASIYSASEQAAAEYPDLDVTVRGAISIAHRLQDPLAELVKIDPKSIGVGQYQHDVNQTLLKKSLEREVESCVNSVGVDVNTASSALLSYVAGIGPKLAQKIVEHRDQNGRFETRQALLQVPKLGKKAFEQAAGFLRIREGKRPLDNSAVHPESYYVVEKMAKQLGVPTEQLVGDESLASRLKAEDFVDEKTGLPTVLDILNELGKPGRDPRREFKTAKFSEEVHEMKDLTPGMALEGVVTNVTHFGAFVDIGVHQDGLIHISELDNTFVQDPSSIVAVGDVVRVKVLEVDEQRRRIALSRKQLL